MKEPMMMVRMMVAEKVSGKLLEMMME